MHTSRIAGCLALILAAGVTACQDERINTETPHAGGTRLILETVLEQTDSVFLGNPIDAAIAHNGDVFVADGMEQRIAAPRRTYPNNPWLSRNWADGRAVSATAAPPHIELGRN